MQLVVGNVVLRCNEIGNIGVECLFMMLGAPLFKGKCNFLNMFSFINNWVAFFKNAVVFLFRSRLEFTYYVLYH